MDDAGDSEAAPSCLYLLHLPGAGWFWSLQIGDDVRGSGAPVHDSPMAAHADAALALHPRWLKTTDVVTGSVTPQ